jgi:hypothetical protein
MRSRYAGFHSLPVGVTVMPTASSCDARLVKICSGLGMYGRDTFVG